MKLSFVLRFSFFLLLLAGWESAFAAACCGGGFAIPSLISGDDKAQASTAYSFSEIAVDNVDSNGVWRKWDHHQQIQNFRFEGARLISDLWQAGLTVPVVQRTLLSQTYSGIGDLSGSLGYEYLPDWDYNPYRPKGLGFLQLTLPTGKSRSESEVGGLDSRGNGFLALGVGTLLTKSWAVWDVLGSVEVHRSFEKSVSNSQVQGTLKPGLGGNATIGGGYNTTSWRYGSSLTWTYEDPVNLRGLSNIDGAMERSATATLAVSYVASDDWAGTFSYSDQTLFGSPTNTSLGRTASLSAQRRWGR